MLLVLIDQHIRSVSHRWHINKLVRTSILLGSTTRFVGVTVFVNATLAHCDVDHCVRIQLKLASVLVMLHVISGVCAGLAICPRMEGSLRELLSVVSVEPLMRCVVFVLRLAGLVLPIKFLGYGRSIVRQRFHSGVVGRFGCHDGDISLWISFSSKTLLLVLLLHLLICFFTGVLGLPCTKLAFLDQLFVYLLTVNACTWETGLLQALLILLPLVWKLCVTGWIDWVFHCHIECGSLPGLIALFTDSLTRFRNKGWWIDSWYFSRLVLIGCKTFWTGNFIMFHFWWSHTNIIDSSDRNALITHSKCLYLFVAKERWESNLTVLSWQWRSSHGNLISIFLIAQCLTIFATSCHITVIVVDLVSEPLFLVLL